MRLIDADELIEFIDMGHLRNPLEACFSERDVVDMLESRETIDAAPVRHGHWVLRIHDEDDDGGYPLYHCSMCDNPRPHKRDNYCPNCGAKMDEVSE